MHSRLNPIPYDEAIACAILGFCACYAKLLRVEKERRNEATKTLSSTIHQHLTPKITRRNMVVFANLTIAVNLAKKSRLMSRINNLSSY
jgi:hypothetical protein